MDVMIGSLSVVQWLENDGSGQFIAAHVVVDDVSSEQPVYLTALQVFDVDTVRAILHTVGCLCVLLLCCGGPLKTNPLLC